MKTPPDTFQENQTMGDHDHDLDVLFAEARRDAPKPGGDFLARLEADALAEMPTRVSQPGLGIWQQIADVIGGWKGIGGLATACAAGLWLGISPPSGIETFLLEAFGGEVLNVDPLNSYDFALMEG